MAGDTPIRAVKFLADVHMPQAIISQARARTRGQIDLVRWGDRGEDLSADDSKIWAVALDEWRVMITADHGFLDRARKAGNHPGIIFVHPNVQGQASIRPVLDHVVFLHEAIMAEAGSVAGDVNNRVWHIT